MSLTVGTDGFAHDLRVARSLGYGLDESAMQAVKRWKFKPAKSQGKPVPAKINIEVPFNYHSVGSSWRKNQLRSKLLNASATIVFVRSALHSRQPLSRVLGSKPLKISAGLKRLLYSVALGVPCALIATGISDSTAVSDFFRYAISPGTALAVHIVHVEPSHRGLASSLML